MEGREAKGDEIRSGDARMASGFLNVVNNAALAVSTNYRWYTETQKSSLGTAGLE